jgi:hypothetical protein
VWQLQPPRPLRQKPQLGNESGFLRDPYHAAGCFLEEEVRVLCDSLLCRERGLDRLRGDLQLHICEVVEDESLGKGEGELEPGAAKGANAGGRFG